ncbi:MAG: radical SAM protein [Candidatus Thorarchaeota archaeon]|nr:radical SAM protein [Candidatus Thorarchaeota archaeon]
MSTVYGPVPSWRFGRSLGIDVITQPKKCTFDCLYCQLGRTKVHVSEPEMIREPLASINKVSTDLENVLKRIDLNTVDIVTFSGVGESTLNPRLGEIADEVKIRIGGLPMAILTNSSLFYRDDVRRNLSKFRMVVAKLDAGDDETFRLVNRPADKKLDIETIVESIKKLKDEIEGLLALEVMLLQTENGKVTNIKGKPLRNLIDAVLDVNPDVVQLEVPYRPPSESFVKPPPKSRIETISKELSETLGKEKLWVYGQHDRRKKRVTWLRHESLEKEVLTLLERRPCRAVDISLSLGIDLFTAQRLLKTLEKNRQVVIRIIEEEKFYFKKTDT